MCSSLTVDSEIKEATTTSYRKACNKAMQQHYTSAIIDTSGNQGRLFYVADKLFHSNSDPILPTHDSPRDLANDFITFLMTKSPRFRRLLNCQVPTKKNHSLNQQLIPPYLSLLC